MEKIDLSVIIVNYNTDRLTSECVESVKRYTEEIKYEVIVIDNSINNLGFAGGNNAGIKKARGRYILFLNSDTLIDSNVLGQMVFWMDKNSKVGIATCSLKNKDGSFQGTGGYFPTLLRVFSWMIIEDLPFVDTIIRPFHPASPKSFSKRESFYKKEQDLDWVTGAFLLVRKEVIGEIGGLDEDYFMYGEDVDFCFRAKEKGWKIKYLPKWSITHFGGSSSTRDFPIISEFKGIKIFYEKHYPSWQYPFLRMFFKIGAFGRMILFGMLEGGGSAKIYAKAFRVA